MAIAQVKAVINGQTYFLNLNGSTGKYEATITAPSTSSYNNNAGHYYPVEITATDDGGNSSTINDQSPEFGDVLRLVVKEKVPPTINITSPTSGAVLIDSKPQFTAELRDNDSGVNISTLIFKIDNDVIENSNITESAVSGGYNISYMPSVGLGDGEHSVSIQVSDNDGNQSVVASVNFTVDTTPPSLEITSPIEGLITNNPTLTVSGITGDITSNPVAVNIKLNSVDQGEVTVDEEGTFAKQVTLADGSNEILITATDSAGKSSSVTRNVTLDTGAPVFQSVTIEPNPVDAGATYIITVEVTD